MEIDERDDPLLPSNGYHTKSTQEVAGLGGNVFFSKAEIQSAWYKRILSNYVRSIDQSMRIILCGGRC
jgi:outer membrane protein assembly factor BamA